MLEDFHFIQPLWLLALLPLAVLLWRIVRRHHANTPWRRLVDPQLLPLLLQDQKSHRTRMPMWLLSAGWLLTVLALADPTWEQLPQPLRQTSASRVIVLDLSRSMLTPDLKPSRLVRARFKVEDILVHDAEGQTGLVVFAGDAFTVSPLTRDADTIRAQLKALHPSIMPSQGSRADLGLLRAQELLQQAGIRRGQVILIADGVEGELAAAAATRLRTSGYEVSVLGVGTAAGAPLPDGLGSTLRDATGKPLVPVLEDRALRAVAQAGGGHYTGLRSDQGDLKQLLQIRTDGGESIQSDDMKARKWKGQGPLLAALLLPLAVLAFRRGWILGILLFTGTLVPPQAAMAFGWDELWSRRDQQAARALHSGEYEQAARIADDPAQRGSALYRQGDFEKALQDFTRVPGADAAYNRGNALARLSKYREAIAAYDQALELQPDMDDALANKAAIEALLNQQARQQQESSDQEGDQDQSSQAEQASSGQDDADQQNAQDPTSQEQQATSPGQDGSDAQGEDRQVDSDGGGNREGPPQSEETPAPDAQKDDREKAERGQNDSENQFADANRQLDKGRDEGQSEPERDHPQQKSDDGQQRAEQDVVEQTPSEDRRTRPENTGPVAEAQALNDEEQIAAQQWLRRIPDDPGGLLRRKFLYQYRQRARPADGSHQEW